MALARRFEQSAGEFATCPLYRQMCLTVSADEQLVRIANERRPGQQPATLLFAAVHVLVLADPMEDLARWYPSIDGPLARPPETVGPSFKEFCVRRREDVVGLLRERLVQTNVVRRAAALRLGLAHVARHTAEPLTLIEVGASAGVLLGFDRYRYRIAGRLWGQVDSPVEIAIEWRGDRETLPDLDAIPVVARRFGIDLAPIDPRDPSDRRWLRALVWPGNERDWDLLEETLDLIASDPPTVIAGDAIEVLGDTRQADTGSGPVVVFHAATRAHVPNDRREAFDAAIRDLGNDRRLFRLSLESPSRPMKELAGSPGHLLELADIDGGRVETRPLAVFAGHGEWAAPLGGPISHTVS